MIFLRGTGQYRITGWIPAASFIYLAIVLFGCSGNGSKEDQVRAPAFTLKDLSGQEVSLSDFRGKVVLLDFWTTWCVPCRASIPHLNMLYKTYRERGLEILGINLDQGDDGSLLTFTRSMKMAYPVLVGTPDVTRSYGVSPIPASFLIDREGKIRLKVVGFNEAIQEKMVLEIEDLLKEE